MPSGMGIALQGWQENQTMKAPSLPILVVDGVVRLRDKLDDDEISKTALRKAQSINGVKKEIDLPS